MSGGAVGYLVESGLGILTMQDGTGTNRLDGPFLEQLLSGLESAYADDSVKAVLLRSGESAFCLGMNLQALQGSLSRDGASPGGREQRGQAVSLYGRLLEQLLLGPKPVIALVEGAVKAGGMGITAACDIVIAQAEQASFELSEVLFGLIPANVLPFLMHHRISPQQARYLILSAKQLSAQDALHLGIVDEVYAAPELERGLKNLLKTMMRAEPGALAAAKRFIGAHIQSGFDEFQDAAEEELLSLMERPQVGQGLQAFHEGDMPPWFDRFKAKTALSGAARQGDGGVQA